MTKALNRLKAAEREFNAALKEVWSTGAKIEVNVVETLPIMRQFSMPIVASKVFRQEY